MSYESAIVEALGLTAPDGAAPATVQSAWTRLQESLTAWRQMHGVSHQSMGAGPSVSMFEHKLAQMVSIALGPVRPDPDTGDTDYNKVLRDFWQETQVDSCSYDLSP